MGFRATLNFRKFKVAEMGQPTAQVYLTVRYLLYGMGETTEYNQ